ncbi:hypothetical protein I9B66_02935 [Campylobacter jejuni]|nr:hypothetical protein [Campylobacter jejuni]
MIVFPLSSFNRYFGNNPLQTLTKIRDESIENGVGGKIKCNHRKIK